MASGDTKQNDLEPLQRLRTLRSDANEIQATLVRLKNEVDDSKVQTSADMRKAVRRNDFSQRQSLEIDRNKRRSHDTARHNKTESSDKELNIRNVFGSRFSEHSDTEISISRADFFQEHKATSRGLRDIIDNFERTVENLNGHHESLARQHLSTALKESSTFRQDVREHERAQTAPNAGQRGDHAGIEDIWLEMSQKSGLLKTLLFKELKISQDAQHNVEETVLWNSRQQTLAWWHRHAGCIGVAFWIAEIAKAEIKRADGTAERETSPSHDSAQPLPRRSQSWQRLIDDWHLKSDSRLIYYLASIPCELLSAVLHGDLPSRMQNSNFARRMESWVRLDDTPGVYSIYMAHEKVLHPTQDAESVMGDISGLNLTINELSTLLDTMSMYIDTNHEKSIRWAGIIDSAIGNPNSRVFHEEGERRYAGGGSCMNVEKHVDWIKAIQDQVVNVMRSSQDDSDKGDESIFAKDSRLHKGHLKRCFSYVGLGKSVLRRATTHWTHPSCESPLFGLITATAQSLWPGRYVIAPYSYLIFRATRPQDVSFVEKVLTIASGGYWYDLGMCYAFAGLNESAEKYMAPHIIGRFEKNARFINASGELERNIQASVELIDSLLEFARDPDNVVDTLKISTLRSEAQVAWSRNIEALRGLRKRKRM